MRKIIGALIFLAIATPSFSQSASTNPKTKIMTLGVFHFAYHNLDRVKTAEKDMISVLDEPYQSQIASIAKSIEKFRPTIIAIELDPARQNSVDSLYSLYKIGKLPPEKSEIYQLAYRIGNNLNLQKIYCVNDWGRHYDNIQMLFKDEARVDHFGRFIDSLDKADWIGPYESPQPTNRQLKRV